MAGATYDVPVFPAKSIGHIGGGKTDRTGHIDVAVIQSLHREDEVKDFVAEYGHVIVDECHHLSAFTFEQVMRQVKAKYIVGLTDTPARKDGHHPIIVNHHSSGAGEFSTGVDRDTVSALRARVRSDALSLRVWIGTVLPQLRG
jgi:hypothetical protein